MFQFQELSSSHFQRGFDRVNLHRPTMASAAAAAGDAPSRMLSTAR